MITITCPSSNDDYYRKLTFPAGEPHIFLTKRVLEQEERVAIEFNFSCSEDIFELLLLAHTLSSNGIEINNLILPYMPFGQADRVNVPGECFSLRLFCDLINNVVMPESITVCDPHSDVTAALLENCSVVHQHEIIAPIIRGLYPNPKDSFYLVCPDAGAEKKAHKLAEIVRPIDIIYCRKTRCVRTGKITGTQVGVNTNLNGTDCVICDDMCVGGRTFIEIAKVLRTFNPGRIILITSNGIYSQGLDVFSDIDLILNQRGRIK